MGAKDATVESVAGEYVLRYERWYPHPVERVWSALTDPDELPGWLAAAAIDLTVGGEVMLHWLNADGDGGEPILHGAITALVPPGDRPLPAGSSEVSSEVSTALLEYATDVHGVLRWELTGDALPTGRAEQGTTLMFTDTDAVSGDFLLRVLTGWHVHLDHLEDFLDGASVDWQTWSPTTRSQGSGLSWLDHWTRYGSRLSR